MEYQMSFGERMRQISNIKKREIGSLDESLEDRFHKQNIKRFFETYIKNPSKAIIEEDAHKGYVVSVIFKYLYYDYFYFTARDELVFTPTFIRDGKHLYRIHTVIREPYFISLMDSFFKNELGMLYDYTRLLHINKLQNGIEVFWGAPEDVDPSSKWFTKRMDQMMTLPPPPPTSVPLYQRQPSPQFQNHDSMVHHTTRQRLH